jgi:hypothetical protein
MTANPTIESATLGNAHVAINCEDLGCLASVGIRVGQDTIDIGCDWGAGLVGTLRGNPTGEISIEAKNVDAKRLKYALDASVAVKSGDYSVDCLKVTSIDWVPDDVATPTEWTAVINLHSSNVDNVVVYDDAACTSEWDSSTTPLNVVSVDACKGLVTLTTDDVDEALDTLYFDFDYMVDLEDGITELNAPFNTFPTDFSVIVWHQNKTTGLYQVLVFWKCQSMIDFNIVFGDYDSNALMTVPIKLRVLSVPDVHPDNKLFGYWEGIVDLPAFLAAIAI